MQQQPTMGQDNPTPKEAAMNLVRSMKTPIVWMAVGAVLTLIFQSRMKKRTV